MEPLANVLEGMYQGCDTIPLKYSAKVYITHARM
jgi:hypothetical protein